ncbi:MAG: TIGR03086 family protein, partial [Actinomycetes bacterium]
MPGEVAGIVALNEVIVHGWDIARATGQPYEADAEHVEVCISTMGPQPGEERPVGDSVAFGRPVDVPVDAPPIDRLVAVLGRDPSWTPPSR